MFTWLANLPALAQAVVHIAAGLLADGEQLAAPGSSSFYKWSKIELSFQGPLSQGLGASNPFDVRLDVRFQGPSGRTWIVPGFYDGDGRFGLDGDVWKVRFSADETGAWSYRTSSSEKRLDAVEGQFVVKATAPSASGFWKWGRLERVGTEENQIRYLKFRDGPFWLKAGCDDPENFLGKYRHYDTLAKRKAAVDELARHGINSLYIMTHNIDGDDKDVWPWIGATPKEAKANASASSRFDVAKLEEWRQLFEHMQTQGVVPYLILEDDSAWKGYHHDRYYREMIARFGYLPALLFNIGEENNENYALAEGIALARRLRDADPYRHPIGIHNVNAPDDLYIDAEHLDLTAIQTGQPGTRKGLKHAIDHHGIALDWLRRCQARKQRILMLNFDEGRPELDRRAWWSAYLGGAVWEAHVMEPYDQPMSAWERVWIELGGARGFMESIPFWEMTPHNDLVEEGHAFCLAQPGHAYALYLPAGGTVTIRLEPSNQYDFGWWDPAQGKDGSFQKPGVAAGNLLQFTAPDESDWALRILRR